MKVNNLIRRILILLIFVFSSCAKEENDYPPTSYDENYFIKCLCSSGWSLSKMELLTDSGWIYHPINHRGDPCQLDDVWRFFYGDTCQYEVGYNCCSDGYFNPIKYYWSISPDSALKTSCYIGTGHFKDKKIIRITKDSLVWLQDWYIHPNGELKVTKMKMTFFHN